MDHLRRSFAVVLLSAGLVAVPAPTQKPAALAGAQQNGGPGPEVADYVAHEWGTFTSMVGTDGAVLEGLQREEEALPPFVHDLLRLTEVELLNTKFPASRVTQKMETPVIYFRTDRPLRVAVRVWFQQGLMTQFYPLPDSIAPPLDELQQRRVDMRAISGSMLHWDVDLVPGSLPAPTEIPTVAADEPWAIARQVRAAFVRTHTETPTAPAEAEHYLFYRGLGRWQPDLQVQLHGDDAVVVRNGMADAVPFAAVLELGPEGGRFAIGQPISAGSAQRLPLPALRSADRALLAGQLGDAVHKALVRSGLEEDEARAMVATWSRSWFQKDGARVIYLLPRPVVDSVLALDLSPRPRELVRTLVGRLEFITARAQARVEAALRAEGDPEGTVRQAAAATLVALDRFLEPHLRNVASNGSDARVRALAQQRLAALVR